MEDDLALVQFAENGKKMHKRVPVDQLQRAQGLPAPFSSPMPRDQLAEMRESTRAVSDRLGTHISFPRTGGGRSNGELILVEGDLALVQFIENGKDMYKRVPADQLQRAKVIPVESGIPVSSNPLGRETPSPSRQSSSPGRRLDPTIADVNFHLIDGRAGLTVPIPGGSRRWSFNTGDTVSFLNSQGGRSQGTLLHINSETKGVRVQFTENGITKVEEISPMDLSPVPRASPSAATVRRVSPSPAPRQYPTPSRRPDPTIADVKIHSIDGRAGLTVPISGGSRSRSFNTGDTVSFLNSQGGRSQGTLLHINPETKSIRVQFVENGAIGVEEVSPLDLLPVPRTRTLQ